ncbi:3',5'-cyclic AMP phosphodiesterase CpdA [Bradyrhizobium sp. LM6.11]
MAPFTLAHLSDPHLPQLPKPRLIELAGKRALGYINWTRNRHKYQRREVLDALVADVKAQGPDHIAVTGDLVNLALEAEFAPARAWLDGVGPPDRVTTIPGNHDAYVRATSHRFGETFAPYLAGDDGRIGFPSVRRRGPLALISLSTAVPTLPLMATGTLGRDQLAALEEGLERLAAEDVFRVLLVHHPLKSGAYHKRMTDSAGLLTLLKRHGVELILHGHTTTFIRRCGSRGPTATFPRSARRRPPRSRTGTPRPRPIICSRSRRTMPAGVASRRCGAWGLGFRSCRSSMSG